MEGGAWYAGEPEDLGEVARSLLGHCPNTRKFAICGEMGVGKTTFIRALCRRLGVSEGASSPTYAIVHEYGNGLTVFHLDLYRLRDAEEVMDLGLETYLDGPEYTFIEWPEKAEPWLDADVVRVRMSMEPRGRRRIRIDR